MPLEEQVPTTSIAFRQFAETCRSPDTRKGYTWALHNFMSYLGLPKDAYDKLLEKDPKIIQMDICDFITHLRKKEQSFATVSMHTGAISKFFTMNDITTLNWKKIRSFEGEREKTTEDRPYTHSEIQLLAEKTTYRNRCIMLLMASAGPRVGALPLVRMKDLQPIDKYNIYKITFYPQSKRSRYFSFCTPETRQWIDLYIDNRKRWGERITAESPLFRSVYNIEGEIHTHAPLAIRPVTRNTIRKFMQKLWDGSSLKGISLEGQKPKRNHIMQCHGFRKFFETNAYKAGMDLMYVRRLMGQKAGLEDSYLKLSEEDLLEGDNRHLGYIGVIDQLTINEENKLRREVHTLKQEVSRFDKMQKQIEELNRRMGLS